MCRDLGLLLLLLLPVLAGPVAASERARIAASAREVHRLGRYPSTLSIGADPAPPAERRRRASGGDLIVIAYVLAALAAVSLLIAALSLRGLSREKEARENAIPAQASTAGMAPEDPETLARRGLHAEAIAALLRAGLRLTGWQPRSEGGLTAREVVGRLDRQDARREALVELLRLAEAVRFAGEPATEAHVLEARRALEAAGGKV